MENQPLKPDRPELITSSNKPAYRDWILMELKKIARLLGAEVTRERIDLTVDELLHIKPDDLQRAFAIARQELKFFPCPAEINAFVKRENTKLKILPYPGAPGANDL